MGLSNADQDRTREVDRGALLREHRKLLELVASAAPIEECLTAICAALRRLSPGIRTCILLADEQRRSFSRVIAGEPELSAFRDGILGAPIDDRCIGTCGEAVSRGRVVECADIDRDARWSKTWRDLCLAHGVRGARSTPIAGPASEGDGATPLGSLFLGFDAPREATEWEIQLAELGTQIAAAAIARERTQRELQAKVADTELLQQLNSDMALEQDLGVLYEKVMDAAVRIMKSDFASMQMLYPERGTRGELRLLGQRGFSAEAARFWEWVRADSGCTCGHALRTGERAAAADVTTCDFMRGTPDRQALLEAGILAAQSTPLRSRSGEIIGMISTHWRRPHEPSERDWRLFDTLARHAAALIERARTDQALRESQQKLAAVFSQAAVGMVLCDPTGRLLEVNPRFCQIVGRSAAACCELTCEDLTHPDDWACNSGMIRDLAEGSRAEFSIEKRYKRGDGSWVWVNVAVSPIREGGRVHRLLAVVEDIDARKKAEEQAASQAAQLAAEAAALSRLNELSSRLWRAPSLEAGLDEMLSATIELLGADIGNVQLLDRGRGVLRIAAQRGFRQDFLDHFREVSAVDDSACGRALRNGERVFIEDIEADAAYAPLRGVARTAGYRAVQSTPLIGRDGSPLGMLSTHFRSVRRPGETDLRRLDLYVRQAVDFIERMESLEALRRSEQELSDFFDTASIGLHWVGPDGIVQRVNPAELRMLGFEREEYLGRHVSEFHADQATCADILHRLKNGEELREYPARLRRKDGSVRDVLINSSVLTDPDGHFVHTRCFTQDVTDKLKAEQLLRDNERRFREMIDALPSAIYTTDAEGRLTHFNAACVELSGRVPELGTDKWCVTWRLYHPDGTPLAHDQCPMAVTLKQGRAVRGAEAIAERPDGSRIWFTPYPTPLFGIDGKVVGGINMLVDITDRKQREEAVRQSEQRLRRMINVEVVGVLIFDYSGTAIDCNDAFLGMTGYSREDIESRRLHWRDMTPPEHIEASERQMEQFVRTLRIGPYEKEYYRKDGSRFWMMFAGADLGDGTIVEYCIDISERKAAEEQLRELNSSLERLVSERTAQLEQSYRRLRLSERMASLGTLAAGLGHDMGNLLLPIRVRLETLEARSLLDDGRQDVAAIRDSLGYLQKLVSGLRLLAIDTSPGGNTDTTELRSWWSDAVGVLRNVLPRGIELKGNPPEAECRVAMPAAALTQAVFNLVQNAGEAMRPAGKGAVTISAERDAGYVRLVIADTGPGMSEEVQRRCMEPFFTTKTRDVSTGLGLALVYGLVRQAGGAVDLQSAPGVGTTFTLYLKCAAAEHPGRESAPRRAVVSVKDARMRAVLRHELRSLSYDVRTDTGAPDDADLIVTDDNQFRGSARGRLVVLADSSAARGPVAVIGSRPKMDTLRKAIRGETSLAAGADAPQQATAPTAERLMR